MHDHGQGFQVDTRHRFNRISAANIQDCVVPLLKQCKLTQPLQPRHWWWSIMGAIRRELEGERIEGTRDHILKQEHNTMAVIDFAQQNTSLCDNPALS